MGDACPEKHEKERTDNSNLICRFAKAEGYLRRAVKLSQKRNPNPYDGEPIYNLGLALKYQGKTGEAYELFWKATWNKAWADAGYFEAAKISVADGRLDDALEELNRCLVANAHNQKALALKASVLRLMERSEEASDVCHEALKTDLFNYGCRYELYLLTGNDDVLTEMDVMMHGNAENYHELALDYANAGMKEQAIKVLWHALHLRDAQTGQEVANTMTKYYLAWMYYNPKGEGRAATCFKEAEQSSPDYCFPNRKEDAIVLELAKHLNPDGARAPYYLGCLYYDARQYDLAIDNWELAARLDPQYPTVWRNLALARFNKQNRQQEALEYMERAFHLNEDDERMLMELDQLYRRLQKPHEERLVFMQRYSNLVSRRDDLVLEEITLLNQTGRYEEALHKLDSHKFHPWEGGEGKVPAQYQICRTQLAKQAMTAGNWQRALTLLEECLTYPPHLGEGKLYGAQENDFLYLMGCVHEALGDTSKAQQCWEEATKGPQEPAPALYYNDAKPDKIFYQGLALQKLGRHGEANGRFHKLVNFGKQHIFEKQRMDYFAVSLPDMLIWDDSLDTKNQIHCYYMLALGYYGLGEMEKSRRYLNEAKKLDINHQGIMALDEMLSAC